MAENKRSFLLYADLIHTVNKLPDKEAGILMKLILSYVNDENPDIDSYDFVIQIAFEPIKQQLKRDLQKYQNIVERNKINGSKGGRPKKAKEPSGLTGNPNKPRKADSDNDTVNGSDMKKYIYSNFYDSEIQKTTNPKYEQFVKYLFGNNKLKIKLSGVLSITNQLKADDFDKVLESCEINKKKIGDIVTKIENDKKYFKGKTNLYRTLLNWAEDRFNK